MVPVQIVVAVAAMLTEGVTLGVTVIVIALDVAVDGLAHAREEVIIVVTISLFNNVALWKVALLVPAFTPFTFH